MRRTIPALALALLLGAPAATGSRPLEAAQRDAAAAPTRPPVRRRPEG